jgi:hypothetical protein
MGKKKIVLFVLLSFVVLIVFASLLYIKSKNNFNVPKESNFGTSIDSTGEYEINDSTVPETDKRPYTLSSLNKVWFKDFNYNEETNDETIVKTGSITVTLREDRGISDLTLPLIDKVHLVEKRVKGNEVVTDDKGVIDISNLAIKKDTPLNLQISYVAENQENVDFEVYCINNQYRIDEVICSAHKQSGFGSTRIMGLSDFIKEAYNEGDEIKREKIIVTSIEAWVLE